MRRTFVKHLEIRLRVPASMILQLPEVVKNPCSQAWAWLLLGLVVSLARRETMWTGPCLWKAGHVNYCFTY